VYLRHLSLVGLSQLLPPRSCRLEPGVTTLIGLNGQGKTNLVEAVGYLATLGSHRVAQDAPLVRFGAEPRRWFAERSCGTAARQLIELEIVPGRANRAA
jgi:DNA replication and repair protein RecF